MCLNRHSEGLQIKVFRDLPTLLRPKSLLVVNNTQVIPARLDARKLTGGKVELLLVRPLPAERPSEADLQRLPELARNGLRSGSGFVEVWEIMAKGLGPKALGMVLEVSQNLWATVLLPGAQGSYKVAFAGHGDSSVLEAAFSLGRLPLPPYIEAQRRKDQAQEGLAPSRDTTTDMDRQRYQTVFASVPGAVAAPTAGLHFTPGLLEQIAAAGHQVATVTLAVGPGTFRPVQDEDPSRHVMDTEHYDLPEATWNAINEARAAGRPVVAVGTTVVRTLEGAARQGWQPGPGSTNIFIKPGDTFAVVTDLITNFHLPRSTLLMLVAAFAGREKVLAAYRAAVEAKLRFYSYGDAMFISPWSQPV